MKTTNNISTRFQTLLAITALLFFSSSLVQAQQKLNVTQGMEFENQVLVSDNNQLIPSQIGGDMTRRIQAEFSMAVRGTKVLFDNTSKGEIEYFLWEFEKCEPQMGVVNPIQVFPGPGTYTVTLLAISKYGISKATKQVTIR